MAQAERVQSRKPRPLGKEIEQELAGLPAEVRAAVRRLIGSPHTPFVVDQETYFHDKRGLDEAGE